MAKRATSLVAIFILFSFFSQALSQIHPFVLTKKYFTDVTMTCDHPDLNIKQQPDIQSLAWIFPDGSTADTSRRPNSKLYSLSGPMNLTAYNLTVFNINDPQFGYYYCVVVYTSESKPLSVIKWGLNTGGADFSELTKTYEENAIIGGIAAAAMLFAIAAGCLLWHFRYSNRHKKLKTLLEEKVPEVGVYPEQCSGYFNNLASEIAEIKEGTDGSVKL